MEQVTKGDLPPLIRDTAAVGARVKALREARDLEQAELAEQAELSRAYVSRLENGGILNPKVYDLARLARVLETSVGHLIDPRPADTDSLRAEVAAHIGPTDAGLIGEVVDVLADFSEVERRQALEIARALIVNWPGAKGRQTPAP